MWCNWGRRNKHELWLHSEELQGYVGHFVCFLERGAFYVTSGILVTFFKKVVTSCTLCCRDQTVATVDSCVASNQLHSDKYGLNSMNLLSQMAGILFWKWIESKIGVSYRFVPCFQTHFWMWSATVLTYIVSSVWYGVLSMQTACGLYAFL